MKKNKIVNPSQIAQNTYSDKMASNRTSDVGLYLKPIGAVALVPIRIAKDNDQYATVVVYNTSVNTVYIKFGDKGVTPATGPTDGFPVLQFEKVVLNAGPNTHIISNDLPPDSCFVYLAVEEE